MNLMIERVNCRFRVRWQEWKGGVEERWNIVDHAILIPKVIVLEYSRIPYNIINWIFSFLSYGGQIVIIKFTKSNPADINMNIIQGSDLDLTLHIIMECDLKPISSTNTIFKDADDINLMGPENKNVFLLIEEFDIGNKQNSENTSKSIKTK